jgi:hypothetical protein
MLCVYILGGSSKKRKINIDVYDQLKESITTERAPAESANGETFDGYVPQTSVENSKAKLKSLLDKISNIELSTMEHKCILGLELANLKFLYIVNKCDHCIAVADIFDVINCKSCTNNKRNNVKQFKNEATSITRMSEDYINFYISLASVCSSFPKFTYVTLSTHIIKSKLKYFRERMLNDASYWQ